MSDESYNVKVRLDVVGDFTAKIRAAKQAADAFGKAANDNSSAAAGAAAYQKQARERWNLTRNGLKEAEDARKADLQRFQQHLREKERMQRESAKRMQQAMAGATAAGNAISQIGGAVGSALGALAGFAKTAALVGGGAILAGATYGVAKLNAELEETKIGIAGVFNANGIGNSFQESLLASNALIKTMRKDAAALPGEFKDLATIFQTASVAGFTSTGASAKELEHTASHAMAVGMGVMGMDANTIGRELAGLYSGHAGGHNKLGMQLMGLQGAEAQRFNRMSGEARYAKINTALDKYEPAIAAYENSFTGRLSSLKDDMKEFGRDSTAGIFDSVKDAMKDIQMWYDTNGEKIKFWAIDIGNVLKSSFDQALGALKLFTPVLDMAMEKMRTLHMPSTSTLAGLAAGAATAAPMMSGFNLAQGVAGSIGTGIGGMIGGPAGGALGGALAPIAAFIPDVIAFGGAWLGVMGIVTALTDVSAHYHSVITNFVADIQKQIAQLTTTLEQFTPALQEIEQMFGVVLLFAIKQFLYSLMGIAFALKEVFNFIALIPGLSRFHVGEGPASTRPDGVFERNGDAEEALNKKKKSITPSVTNHTTHIHKVEITVASNQDPSRIAHLVKQDLLNLARNPNHSRNGQAPYWSGPR